MIISYVIFYTIHKYILTDKYPVRAARKYVPYYVAITVGICSAFLLVSGPKAIRVPYHVAALVFIIVSVAVILLVQSNYIDTALLYGNSGLEVKKGGVMKGNAVLSNTSSPLSATSVGNSKRIVNNDETSNIVSIDGITSLSELESATLEAEAFFLRLMILTAAVVSFAHGSNDVSNCIGPFVAVNNIYTTGEVVKGGEVPFWILLAGGAGIG